MTGAGSAHPDSLGPSGLLAHYAPHPGVWDEWYDPDGQLREHCRPLVAAFSGLGMPELLSRRESAASMLRDHGVNFDLLGDRHSLERPWELDLLPLPLASGDWERVEEGLRQRTRLLQALLADCYGPQTLVRDGVVPHALLHGNPAFIRPACHLVPASNRPLVFHAIDLGRSPDGRWCVLSDRTRAPSGTGYALENRLVTLRVFPAEFRAAQVQRLAAYFQHQRDGLRHLAPWSVQPNMVVLTPGPSSPNYFEHAYLARYLAFPLVEGGDLTVRNNRVFLKTLEGLQPVDVILRHLPDEDMDPLELRAGSVMGVPGLLQAVRSGTVAVANPIGSGLAEAPGWLPFLPAVCRHLLGEDLRLASTPTWWCGRPRDREHVLSRLDQLEVRPAFEPRADVVVPARLSRTERERLVEAMRFQPHTFVAQEPLVLSRAPCWMPDRCESRTLQLRAFVCAGPSRAMVLPGGLTRLAVDPAATSVPAASGGACKDTWVLSLDPVAPVSLIRTPTTAVRLERAAAEVPSRVADNLFWLGRYAERLEDLLRILRSVFRRLVGEARFEQTPELRGLVRMMVYFELLPERFTREFPLRTLELEVLALLHRSQRLGTIPELLGRLHRVAWNVRDRLSADMWRNLNRMLTDARPAPARLPLAEGLAVLNNLIADLSALSGLEMENMTRGHGWRFLQMGRRVERASNLATLAQAGLVADAENLRVLEAMLEIADSTMTYRRLYFAQPLLSGVLDLLVADEANPRSLVFQIHELAEHASHLPRFLSGGTTPEEQAPMDRCLELLREGSFHRLETALSEARRREIHATLEAITRQVHTVSNSLTHHYFSHAETRVI